MQIPPQDDLTLAQKRAILCDLSDLQNKQSGLTLCEACRLIRRSVSDIKLWQKEVAASDGERCVQKAVRLYDLGWTLRRAAQHGICTEQALTKALKSRGRRRASTLHISVHHCGRHTAAY